MKIPICNQTDLYGRIINTTLFNTKTYKFETTSERFSRELPELSYIDYQITSKGTATILGKVRNEYVVNFGDKQAYLMNKDSILKAGYKLSNIKIIASGKFISIDGKLDDLSKLFPDTQIKFIGACNTSNKSSIGFADKFIGQYKGKKCVIKFSKPAYSNQDILNEFIYYKIATILKIPCCTIYLSEYFGRKCCISMYEYDTNNDIFISFRNTGKSISEIYRSFSQEDRNKFDKMMILDYIVEQQDRHLSNLALVNGHMYSSYDNGECLGIGAQGYYSAQFRKYVEANLKNRIKDLINCNKLKEVMKLPELNANQKQIIGRNIKKLLEN